VSASGPSDQLVHIDNMSCAPYVRDMTRESNLAWAAAVVTLGLTGVSSILSVGSMWGLNHLAFLHNWWLWALLGTTVIVTIIAFSPGAENRQRVNSWIECAHKSGALYSEIGISLLFGLLYYLFLSETHFLGDGYTLTSVYGVEGSFIRRWPEPGSYVLIRVIQHFHFLGGENRETLIQAMQLLSIGSGIAFVFCSLRLPRYFSDSLRVHALASITLISGTIYMMLAVRYLKTGKGLALTLIFFALAALVHFQALAFAQGVALLVSLRYFPTKMQKLLEATRLRWWFLLGLGTGILITSAMAEHTHTNIFLHLFDFRQPTHGYAALSWMHILDLINQTFVIYPGVLMLVTVILSSHHSSAKDRVTTFLGLTSLGSLLFLITVDPVLGMARDWDLMSFPLLPIGLYILYKYNGHLRTATPRVILMYLLVCAFATAAFIASNVSRLPSEARFASLLQHYGSKDESGWAILDYYYLNEGRSKDVISFSQEMLSRGIREADAHYALGKAYRRQGDVGAAVNHFESATRLKSGNPRWLNDLGQAYLDRGRVENALAALRESRRLAPSWTVSLESLALVAIRTNDYEKATSYADTLFMQDPHSPGGYLIYMVVELNRGNSIEAARHYEDFGKFGTRRSDYLKIRDHYGPVINGSAKE